MLKQHMANEYENQLLFDHLAFQLFLNPLELDEAQVR